VTGGVPLGKTPDEQGAALAALRKQVDVLAGIVKAESKLCGLGDREAERLAERIIYWLAHGVPMPARDLNTDELDRTVNVILDAHGEPS
jgi:hypothetical protein